MSFLKKVYQLLLLSAKGFAEDRAMKMSASLAYYAIFSVAPLLLIVIWLIGFIYGGFVEGNTSIQAEIFNEFTSLFGAEVAIQIQQTIQKISISDQSGIGIAAGIVTLIIGSTTIFVDIQHSLNSIWGVKPKPKKGWVKMLLNRVISLSMVLGLGFLLIVSLLLNGIIAALSSYLTIYFENLSVYLMEWINTGITFLIITILFATIFTVLPDGKIRFKDAIWGALFTAGLFMLGRYLISIYMLIAAPASAYGAAGSIIILLLWIYYSAAILYFGAEFTKVYAEKYGRGIVPSSFAVRIIHQEVEKNT